MIIFFIEYTYTSKSLYLNVDPNETIKDILKKNNLVYFDYFFNRAQKIKNLKPGQDIKIFGRIYFDDEYTECVKDIEESLRYIVSLNGKRLDINKKLKDYNIKEYSVLEYQIILFFLRVVAL
jgi:DNA-dependent RNA polymerase auxiliary subunit epsilon